MDKVSKSYLIGVDISQDDFSTLVVVEREVQDGKTKLKVINTFCGDTAERIYKFLTRPRGRRGWP